MRQSRTMSLVKSVANVLVGYSLAMATQLIVFPWFGLEVTIVSTLSIGAIFTIVTIARSYALRRFFESIRMAAERRSAADG